MFNGKNRKTSRLFHSGGDKTNINALFWMLTLGHISCYFAFLFLSFIIIQGWRVKYTLSIKILVLLSPALEFFGCQKRRRKKS